MTDTSPAQEEQKLDESIDNRPTLKDIEEFTNDLYENVFPDASKDNLDQSDLNLLSSHLLEASANDSYKNETPDQGDIYLSNRQSKQTAEAPIIEDHSPKDVLPFRDSIKDVAPCEMIRNSNVVLD